MATTLEREVRGALEPQAPSGRRRSGWWIWVLSAAAVLTVVAAVAVALWPEPQPRPIEQQQASGSLYTEQEQLIRQLVAEGVLPEETLDGGVFLIKSLINQGLIPIQTVQERFVPVGALYTPEERTVMRLVNQGLLPRETLDSGVFLIKSLINQGLIPREAANSGGGSGS
jgi:hypothetical protein